MMTSATHLRVRTLLITLTCLFVLGQIALLVINAATSHFFDTAVSTSLTRDILSSSIFLFGLARFLLTHVCLYALWIAVLWYLTIATSELLKLSDKQTSALGLFIFCISCVCVFTANYYFVPHSFFSTLLRNTFLTQPLNDAGIWYALAISCWLLLAITSLALCQAAFSLLRHEAQLRHFLALAGVGILISFNTWPEHHKVMTASAATVQKPTIVLIGIDAVRPDFVGFYNKNIQTTPTIDAFLQQSVQFTAAYTPLPRTFPSWTGILTGAYPKRTGARGNNTDLSEIKTDSTLPKTLQQAGYETVYSTDDTRFNNMTTAFGFDHVITPPMGLNDFLLGTINDFPLSNLVITTRIGQYLFPYNFANHGTAITYAPGNYLHLLTSFLTQPHTKPLFLAVHFTVTHWPFYWFNDNLSEACHEMCRYQAGIAEADKQVNRLLQLLQKQHLLDHAIVVLLSDHGTSMGLPGDRITDKTSYQGHPERMKKLSVMKYSHAPANSLNMQQDYGINTSYGYGGDVLSLKQYRAVLAMRGYGVELGTPHAVTQRVLLLDIAPTLLAKLQLPPLASADGVSLLPYVSQLIASKQLRERPFFLESSFTLEEIEREGISVNKVLAKAAKLYRMDPKTGLIFIKKNAEQSMDQNKQRAILQGDWLLAVYPESLRSKWAISTGSQKSSFKSYSQPAYPVLVNVKTGAWTLELNTPLARAAPLALLRKQLYDFYGKEIPAVQWQLPG